LSQEPDIQTTPEQVEPLENVNQDLVRILLERISTLEVLNDHLARSLKSCIKLLTQFKEAAPNPDGWQDLLETLEFNLKAAESIQEQKMFNLTCGIAGKP
jgi:hypothetical protein